MDRLATIEGYDVDMALRSVSGQEVILERVLHRFVSTYRNGLPELLDDSGSDAEVVDRWHKVCHSVRGALTTIGASSFVAGLKNFERKLGTTGGLGSMGADARLLHAQMLQLVERLAKAL